MRVVAAFMLHKLEINNAAFSKQVKMVLGWVKWNNDPVILAER
jgi:hypothetical protein